MQVTFTIDSAQSVTIGLGKDADGNKLTKQLDVDVSAMPEASLVKIFMYGLQRIHNDVSDPSGNGNKFDLAVKKRDALVAGVLRQSPNREGDPVKREAKRLAEIAITGAAKWKAWLQENKLKASDKAAREQLAALVEKNLHAFMAKAQENVEAARGITVNF